MERIVTDPIHLPCPDMVGCINPDPAKTANSLHKIAQLREKFAEQFPKKKQTYIPTRFRQGVVA
ncbi:hypothetical protein P3719_04635 [Vibrio parahaemolyticus]|uniref:hypothetical protein n=1 Tax=Vibrio parahaemolyticus TaxID=670 RepID=UPI0009355446|nr:hypothetical protein [Vibrio parahaemolyticus]MCA6688057.1 hypothetical protein [Vibrio parahaemolyticus]MDF5582154.1 hypothetical protein [Vibrio parahaemolyticus]MDF5587648.1 hypothetical protein [Vibrio parahaemolyticus]MDG2874894.1 hypothetical protein [Vibrio parahaemolyticus]MDG2892132.1 hypothetical protein [Vibrio parahaemolyticus]